MLQRSTIQLLRFHFSFFLLPVYLFALSQLPLISWTKAVLIFIILHLLVYPSSNGYNSYMDRDESPIGGLALPLPPTRQLFYVTIAMDALAVLLSLLVDTTVAICIIIYITASRAYSYRGIRLKQYPVTGFLTVFIFQGALIFFMVYEGSHPQAQSPSFLPLAVASLLIGALYPLTQIYQHEEDKRDGVITLSYRLGKKGTFLFSMLLFLLAAACLFLLYRQNNELNFFLLFLLFTLPAVLFFITWMRRVWKNGGKADFKHSLCMNVIATFCTAAFFTTLIILKHFE